MKASERSIQTWQFDYTGKVQEFTVPQTGLYQLDVYGASSRSEFNARGGLGGHSSGKIQLEAGDKLYIAVGGIGTAWTKTGNSDIGPDIFNGGGNAYSYGGPSRATAGGGATHIALGGGQLFELTNERAKVLIVAGGGGGVYTVDHSGLKPSMTGGSGGGETGGNASTGAVGATQADGNTFGKGGRTPGSGGGGGGWYGGVSTSNGAGSGGSGYIKEGLIDAITENGVWNGNGRVIIQLLEVNENERTFNEDLVAPDSVTGLELAGSEYSSMDITINHSGKDYGTIWNENEIISGVKGFYYVADNNKDTVVTPDCIKESTGGFTDTTLISGVDLLNNGGKTYVHVAAVDNNGNVSETYTMGWEYISLTVDYGNGGTGPNGVTQQIFYGVPGQNVKIQWPDVSTGFDFLSFELESTAEGSGVYSEGVYTFQTYENTLKAKYIAPLTISGKYNIEDKSYLLHWEQDDDIPKQYKIYESRDGIESEIDFNSTNSEAIEQRFKYTGGVQEFEIPVDGYYYIEAVGGGAHYTRLTYGAKVSGIQYFTKGTKLYFAVGGIGKAGYGGAQGGWNGGGSPIRPTNCYSGGGATSITLVNRGELKNFESDDRRQEIVMVAGGASACYDAPAVLSGMYDDGTELKPFGGGWSGDEFTGCGGGFISGNPSSGAATGGTSYIWGTMLNQECVTQRTSHEAYALIRTVSLSSNNLVIYSVEDTKAPNKASEVNQVYSADKATVIWKDNGDNGSHYEYRVESYDFDMNKLRESVTLEQDVISGVKGFYYYYDNNSTGVADTDDTYTSQAQCDIPWGNEYLHIAVIDNSGNISETLTIEIPQILTIIYDGNETEMNVYGDRATTQVTGKIKDQTVIAGQNVIIKGNVTDNSLGDVAYQREGYEFAGWNIKKDAKIGGSAIGENGLRYTGEFIPVGEEISYAELTASYGNVIYLYAVWEPIRYKITFHGNNNSNIDEVGDTYEQELRFDHIEKLKPSKFKRTNGWKFEGWGYTPEQSVVDFADEQYINNLTSDKSKKIDLYALWTKKVQLTIDLNGGSYNNQPGPFILEGHLFNNCNEYPFNIVGNGVVAVDGKYSAQHGYMDIYGTVINNGLNQNFTKIDNKGKVYRLLGWSTNKNATAPDSGLIIYDSGRNTQYKAGNSITLYAVWEEILQVNMELTRTLGTLAFQDETDEQAKNREKCYNVTNGNPGEVSTILRPTEQGRYKFETSSKIKSITVKFSDDLINFYKDYENDGLNPINDEAIAFDSEAITGLNRLITSKFTSWRAFYIPTYIDKISKDTFDADFTFSKESFYYKYVYGTDESAVIHGKIYLGSTISGGDSDETNESIISELKTRIRLVEK